MKEIKAYIKAVKQEAVTLALHQIEGISGASFSDVLGFGRRMDQTSGFSPDSDPSGYVRHVKLEVVCPDSLEEIVVDTICQAARTGLQGDGKIYVSDIARAVRVQDGSAAESG